MGKRIQRRRGGERGALLIASYLALAVLGIFSIGLYSRHFTTLHTHQKSQHLIKAFHLAEAGLDRAIDTLKGDPNYTGVGYTEEMGTGEGGYEIQVENLPPPAGALTLLRRIVATGHFPNNDSSSYAYARRQVEAHLLLSPQSPFTFSLFSDVGMQISGNVVTDSYDSKNGPYSPFHAGTNGDIGTNASVTGSINLSGNVLIRGDAVAGPGADVSTAITTTGNVVIEGTKTAATSSTLLNSVQIPSSLTNSGNLQVSGNTTLTLPAGTYWYDTIQITGNGKVNFSGAATVYVTGRLEISGNGIGTAQNLPTNLLIYTQGVSSGIPGGGDVRISGNGSFYGAIYAPDSKVQVSGNGQLYGSLVGDSLHISGNGKIHYDEALSGVGGDPSHYDYDLVAWQEL